MPVKDAWHTNVDGQCPYPRCRAGKLPTAKHGRPGARWRVRYKHRITGEWRDKMFDAKGEAQRWEDDYKAGRIDGTDTDKMTVKEWGEKWRDAQGHHKDSTQQRVRSGLDNYVYPLLGEKPLTDIDSITVQEWVKKLQEKNLKPSTVKLAYGYLRAMMEAAADNPKRTGIERNPCSRKVTRTIPKPKKKNSVGGTPPMATADVRAISDAFASGRLPHYAALPLLAAATGLRGGELWGLEQQHVDLENREINVVQQLKWVLRRTPPYYLGSPKTETSVRTGIKIPPYAADALRRHMERFPPIEIEIDYSDDHGVTERRKAKLIFYTASGRPIDRSTWSRAWKTACMHAGLGRRYTFHDLRNYYTNETIDGGTPIAEVQARLGHANASTTLDKYYGHRPNKISEKPADVVLEQSWGRK